MMRELIKLNQLKIKKIRLSSKFFQIIWINLFFITQLCSILVSVLLSNTEPAYIPGSVFFCSYLFMNFMFIFFGTIFSAKTATITKPVPTQSIGIITNPKHSTDPIVADNGSKASSRLTVAGFTYLKAFAINWNGIIVPITITAAVHSHTSGLFGICGICG